jgi:hypothetical protein
MVMGHHIHYDRQGHHGPHSPVSHQSSLEGVLPTESHQSSLQKAFTLSRVTSVKSLEGILTHQTHISNDTIDTQGAILAIFKYWHFNKLDIFTILKIFNC